MASPPEAQGDLGGREHSSSFLGTPGVVSQSKPYRGTPPMHIDASDPHMRGVPSNGPKGVPSGVQNGVQNGPNNDDAGVSFGIDVSHMAPAPRPVDPAVLDRAITDKTNDFGGATENDRVGYPHVTGTDPEKAANESSRPIESGAKELAQSHRAVSEGRTSGDRGAPSTVTYPSRPLLDEAISWDRLAGVGKENKKRRWWHMP